MGTVLTVPGVYSEPAPRVPLSGRLRTDIAGFVGFDPRFSMGATPSAFTGTPPTGHRFSIGVAPFRIPVEGRETDVPATPDMLLSESSSSPLLNDGQSIYFTLALAASGAQLLAIPGAVAMGTVVRPSETDIHQLLLTTQGSIPEFSRLADIEIRRVADSAELRVRGGTLRMAVRNGTTPSRFTGGPPPTGHEFRIDILASEVFVAGELIPIPAQSDFLLSANAAATLLTPGESIIYTLIGVRTLPGLVTVQGTSAPNATPSDDGAVNAAIQSHFSGPRQWIRLANILFRRTATVLDLTITPTTGPIACNDFRDYVRRFGPVPEDTRFLGRAARGYFANGGSRAWIATVSTPQTNSTRDYTAALEQMIGIQGSSLADATGVERLLLENEVSIIDVPDLYASHAILERVSVQLPPEESATCFGECDPVRLFPSTADAGRRATPTAPIYSDDQVWDAQRRMITRIMPERWRVLLVLTAPQERDSRTGQWHGPSVQKAQQWRSRFTGLDSEEALSTGAFYFPWLLIQEEVGGPVRELPPTPFAAGIIARRDLARGPFVSPANETVRTAVGLSQPVDDAVQSTIYAPPGNINVFRPFAGYGIQLWGARTLSDDRYLRFLSVRRCLTAIEKFAAHALQQVVFEPNTLLLWVRVNQIMLQILLDFFEKGAFRGKEIQECFYIRCDASNNDAESIQNGQLIVEVGVAVAAPAEFIVFRLGRREGVVEVLE